MSAPVTTAADAPASYSAARDWLLSLPVGLLLLLAVLFGTSTFIHAQLLSLGGHIWENYSFLRVDMPKPACDPKPDINALIQQRTADSGGGGGGLLDLGPVDPEVVRESLRAQRERCQVAFERYRINRQLTARTGVQVYRSLELVVGQITRFGQNYTAQLFVLLVFFGALAATLLNDQIALRFSRSRLDYRFSAGAQVLTAAMLAFSAAHWLAIDGTGAGLLNALWVAGFTVLALAAGYRLLRVPRAGEAEGSIAQALLAVPLYCWLGLACAVYFLGVEQYPAGPVVQLTKMVRFADLYTAIGLYVWVGMLLKHTRLAELLFNLLDSWRLPPAVILVVVVLAAAWPTAYTGASGIFVLAMGAVIYRELSIAGNRRQLAVAATAMSGSMGVVLSPCLMIVIIAALNRQVTTDQLFGWGFYVYLLSAAVFCLAVFLAGRGAHDMASRRRHERPGLFAAIKPLLPYVVIGAAVLLVYTRVIGETFNEFSAPVILPVVLLFLLAYDRWRARRLTACPGPRQLRPAGFFNGLRAATAESAVLLGALLTLMVLSIVFGGVMARSGVMGVFPEAIPSVWLAMAILVAVLVVIGMIMEPYGAIILVSATLAPVAYANGIHPVHFWMTVLVAFELGYLSPPVALNQLLTRQVVGPEELARAHAEVAGSRSFWRRHEAMLLPIVVMGTALLLVAFVPLIVL